MQNLVHLSNPFNPVQIETSLDLAIIGGGAAGCFAAAVAAEARPGLRICVFEKSQKLLAKVRISGGGRCNVTHACDSPAQLARHYPRGAAQLRKAFSVFQASDTERWFAAHGVRLKTEADGRRFPVTDDSETIIRCLLDAGRRAGVLYRMGIPVLGIEPLSGGGFRLRIADGVEISARRVLVASGGFPKAEAYAWLERLGHTLVPPVPSLFTFNLVDSPFRGLEGVSVAGAEVRIAGTSLRAEGPVLVTHWGLSGPAVLRVSAWGARILHEMGYRYTVLVNWLPGENPETLARWMEERRRLHPKKLVVNEWPGELPRRLWERLCQLAEIPEGQVWGTLERKPANRLVQWLLHTQLQAQGKTTFKEEFVTAGGVSLDEVDFRTMESRRVPGLHFAGEVLDVDGITGGFNFQAAWTTGWIAAQAIISAIGR